MKASSYKIWLLCLITLTAILLVIGLVTPIITFKKFVFIQNTFSILSGTWQLFQDRQLFLFVIIALFSIILPIFKLGLLTKLVLNEITLCTGSEKALVLIHRIGKWSMLDVFVVAILVVVVKLGAIADVEKHIGLYAYASAALLTMLITNMVIKIKDEGLEKS